MAFRRSLDGTDRTSYLEIQTAALSDGGGLTTHKEYDTAPEAANEEQEAADGYMTPAQSNESPLYESIDENRQSSTDRNYTNLNVL